MTTFVNKDGIEFDVDDILTDLNNKADVDLINVNTLGLDLMSNAGMPSGRSEDMAVGASGTTYVVPSNGWVVMKGASTSSFGFATLYTSEGVDSTQALYSSSIGFKIHVPVRKGSTVTIGYSNVSITAFQFVYAQGASN